MECKITQCFAKLRCPNYQEQEIRIVGDAYARTRRKVCKFLHHTPQERTCVFNK